MLADCFIVVSDTTGAICTLLLPVLVATGSTRVSTLHVHGILLDVDLIQHFLLQVYVTDPIL